MPQVKSKDDVPTGAEFASLRSFLQGKGLKVKDLADSIGDLPRGRAKKAIAQQLALWLRDRPKG